MYIQNRLAIRDHLKEIKIENAMIRRETISKVIKKISKRTVDDAERKIILSKKIL